MHTNAVNKKHLLILVLITLVVAGGLVGFSVTRKKADTNPSTTSQPTAYKTQQECEAATGKPCQFSMCDYKCTVYFKGWVAATDKVN
jgi:hypothetical protein